MNSISIVGSGYVGLTTALGFASLGMKVVCVDNRKEIVDNINASKSPIFEPGVENAYQQAGKNLTATQDI